jgi:nucleotide-binding universal stress UspA family protein
MLQNVKSILIGLTEEGDPGEAASALPYGLSLARIAGAHATIQAASLRLVLTGTFVSDFAAELVTAENVRLETLAAAAAENAREAGAAAGVTCTSRTSQLSYPDLLRTFTDLARVHDLTVLDAEPVALAVDRGLIEHVLLGSGRPLLVVPAGRDTFAAERIVVAWDASAKASRAVHEALPFLRAADEVEVVCVTGEKDLPEGVPGADIAPYLARHGVRVTLVDIPVEGGDVAQTLRNRATLFGADLLVMGAFVHSRLRQMVFGGVTQSMLTGCPVPLLLSS